MIQINKENAEKWIERFLQGETTNEEELELYRFFANKDVPPRLDKYRKMFGWYANGMKDPLPKAKSHHATIKRLHPIWLKLSIAAIVVLACGISLHLYFNQNTLPDYSCYEGSYIIRNGKKITDLNVIMPELQKTMKEAEQKEAYINRSMKRAESDPEKEIEKQILENIPDEATKKIVIEMLNE